MAGSNPKLPILVAGPAVAPPTRFMLAPRLLAEANARIPTGKAAVAGNVPVRLMGHRKKRCRARNSPSPRQRLVSNWALKSQLVSYLQWSCHRFMTAAPVHAGGPSQKIRASQFVEIRIPDDGVVIATFSRYENLRSGGARKERLRHRQP